jgi:ABC-type transport system involved in multi-copper enzyme maturation permease subunit
MPIHHQGYRRWGGERRARGRSWSVIAAAGIRAMLRKRMFLALLLVAWLPFFARALQIYASINVPQATFLAPTSETFRDFLSQQDVFVLLVAVYVGAGLIANDRRANALQIYLSKPLARGEYIFGKFAILVTFLLLITWVPAVVLMLLQVLLAGSVDFVVTNSHLFPAITLSCAVQSVTVAAAMLALSSLSRSSRYVGILYAVIVFLTQAVYGVLRVATGDSGWAWISPTANMTQVANAFFRLAPAYDVPWLVSLALLSAIVVASSLVLERRVRAVEVVA